MTPTTIRGAFLLAALALPAASPAAGQESAASAQPTLLTVRVVSHDAKVIGTGVGGARVTIRDVESGRVIAMGVQEGGTGSTPLIMEQPRERGSEIYGGAAVFTATLDLVRPTHIEVAAEGPLGTVHALQRATKTLLMVPGRDVAGDGLVLELHGFTVEILGPTETEASGTRTARAGQPLEVRARVTMLCGCPTQPGGTWDADRMDIVVRILRDGRVLVQAPLAYAGTTSTFAGSVVPPEAGTYELQILAVDEVEPNAGIVSVRLVVEP